MSKYYTEFQDKDKFLADYEKLGFAKIKYSNSDNYYYKKLLLKVKSSDTDTPTISLIVHSLACLQHSPVRLFVCVGKPVAERLTAEIVLLAAGYGVGLIPVVEQGVFSGLYHIVTDEGNV